MAGFLSIDIGALYNKRKLQAKHAVDLHNYFSYSYSGDSQWS